METCPICLGDETDYKTYCNHSFHRECLQTYVDIGGYSCPVCRKQLNGFFARSTKAKLRKYLPVGTIICTSLVIIVILTNIARRYIFYVNGEKEGKECYLPNGSTFEYVSGDIYSVQVYLVKHNLHDLCYSFVQNTCLLTMGTINNLASNCTIEHIENIEQPEVGITLNYISIILFLLTFFGTSIYCTTNL